MPTCLSDYASLIRPTGAMFRYQQVSTLVFTALLLASSLAAATAPDFAVDVAAGRGAASSPWGAPPLPFTLVKKWDDLSPEEKKRVKEARERYQKLPDDRQEKLRRKWEEMPKQEREKYKIDRKYR